LGARCRLKTPSHCTIPATDTEVKGFRHALDLVFFVIDLILHEIDAMRVLAMKLPFDAHADPVQTDDTDVDSENDRRREKVAFK
jgi:hypothetical protein